MVLPLKRMVFGLMALLGAMGPDLLQAQLRNHNIWSIGNRGYVMDFKQYPPTFYMPTEFNSSFNQSMSYLTDSAGDFYLGMRVSTKPCGERIVNRYLQADSAFPNFEDCDFWSTFMFQMPDYRRSSILRDYGHYHYTKRFPLEYSYLLNLSEDTSRFIDTTSFDFGYKYSSGVSCIIYAPDCQAVYM
jgi:hypothetical protein